MDKEKLFGKTGIFSLAVIVSALGYFVDIYDIVIFGIVRTPSLRDIGIPESEFFSKGVTLINTQMLGMLMGGVLFGIMGDRRGRISLLFASILLYSLANIANAFVVTYEQYVVLRFLAGVGLAGEIGGAITLVSEVMPKERRGYGATVIASLGFSGAIFAALVSELTDWRMAYIVGGVMGLLLLALRMKLLESGMFNHIRERKDVSRGNPLILLWPPRRLLLYVSCILVGVPIYYLVMVFGYFAPELAKDIGATEPLSAHTSLMWFYTGLVIGGIASGVLSELFKSRRLIIGLFLLLAAAGSLLYLYSPSGMPASYFYGLTVLVGIAGGYCVLFFIVAAEQFGTNIRATAATSVANVVRASTLLITSSYAWFKAHEFGLQESALIIGAVSLAVAFTALAFIRETYGRDLDYVEEK